MTRLLTICAAFLLSLGSLTSAQIFPGVPAGLGDPRETGRLQSECNQGQYPQERSHRHGRDVKTPTPFGFGGWSR